MKTNENFPKIKVAVAQAAPILFKLERVLKKHDT
jgi:hypothetical protein